MKEGKIIRLLFNNSNENSDFVKRLVELIYKQKDENYWGISDLEIVPKSLIEYSGTGSSHVEEKVWNLYKKVQKNKIEFLNNDTFIEILMNTLTIRNAVIMCFSKEIKHDYKIRARVSESKSVKLQHEKATVEIQILDGDLFTIYCRNCCIEAEILSQFSSYILED